MSNPSDRKYHSEHTWAKVEGDLARIGITDFAQEQLGDIVFVDLPSKGGRLTQGESFGTVESAKTVSDLIAPVSGEVVEVNSALDDDPETVNESPYENGWMVVVRIDNPGELDDLLSADAYEQVIEDE
ncbi:MAG: glycine cleavage system protein GcvH [Alicyclobacillus herbarius]|uniref:glycine cleavage system protein GcvH n=1 Tax=Alicyclobacillus herbarius TaxID=122960 RepID=UPI00235525CC|nr:glycine cleavage system protein GcvH [Alicyclobacillus herbarius]MCL6633796.1 glycine cleavage system protein GcvH [Alicyclobacillus herbarius]